jgi:geranylgeranyl reductase family protein
MLRNPDVTVIGAGPAGARCAELLAANGHSVLMIEKDSFPGETNVCGGILDASFVRELALPASMIKETAQWLCHFGSEFIEVKSRKISFARNKFDRYLANRAISRGAELLSSTRAISAERNGRGITVLAFNRKTGERELVRSNIVVFADGPNTMAQRSFQIGFRSDPRNTAIGAISEFEHDGSGDTYELFFDKTIFSWGYGWIIPKPDHLNVGMMCKPAEIGRGVREHLEYFVDGHLTGPPGLRGLRFATGLIPLAPAEILSGERVLTVGDAAGMVDPIWGDGIRYGLRAAECAAKVGSEALSRDRYDTDSLAEYDTLWRRTSDYEVLKRAKLLSDIALRLRVVWPNVYGRLVNFGVSHQRLQHLLGMQVKQYSALDSQK